MIEPSVIATERASLRVSAHPSGPWADNLRRAVDKAAVAHQSLDCALDSAPAGYVSSFRASGTLALFRLLDLSSWL